MKKNIYRLPISILAIGFILIVIGRYVIVV